MSDDCTDNELTGREPGAIPAPPVEPPVEPPDGSIPEPDPTPPQFVPRNDLYSMICSVGSLQPQLLNGVFMNLLADHFSSPQHIWQVALRKYIWQPGPASKIQIAMNFKWSDVDSADTPVSIVIKRGAQSRKQLGIGGRGETLVDGQVMHSMVTGSHTFTAIGGSGAETELLGEELAMMWEHEAYRMTQDFFFHQFQLGGVSEVGPISELGDTLGVQITINYQYESIVVSRPIEPIHKVFTVDVAGELQ